MEQLYYLEGTDGSTLETQISFEILSDFSYKSLERQFPDEQLSRFLVSSNFSKGYSTGPKFNDKEKA